jgi:hypothetical protein
MKGALQSAFTRRSSAMTFATGFVRRSAGSTGLTRRRTHNSTLCRV